MRVENEVAAKTNHDSITFKPIFRDALKRTQRGDIMKLGFPRASVLRQTMIKALSLNQSAKYKYEFFPMEVIS